ncbi:MAG: hypothetical protein HYZ31_07890 [Gammaproteobacteria bacterium]|nr:hypothetical protein [Gammaproteobacteria bacterium]
MIYLKIASIFFVLVLTGSINAAPITSLQITGGSFLMAGAGGAITPGAYANMTVGGYDGSSPLSGCPCTAPSSQALYNMIVVALQTV